MRDIGQETVPTSEADKEVFLGLRLAEPSERVKITLDERMLSIEGKKNATVDMRLHAISTMKHHSTNLVPVWLVVLGFALMWIGYRILVPPIYRLAFMGTGAAIAAARLLTKKPTLTIHASSGDSHVLYGNERLLNRLSFMFQHLATNSTLAEVRIKLEAIESDYNRGWQDEDISPAPLLPNVLQVPHAVDRFLAEDDGVLEGETSFEPEPDWTPTLDPEPAMATSVLGYIQSFQPVLSTPQATTYPPDHRPAPLQHPVLIPQSTPPMYQGQEPHQAPAFLPSFGSQDGFHIPGISTDTAEEEEPDSLVLDAELIQAIDAMVEIEPEGEPALQPPVNPPRTTMLKPREPTSIEQSSFRPRRTDRLVSRERRSRSMFSRIRETSTGLLERATQRGRPRPYATTETSGALREQAEASSFPSSQHVMESLSQDRGGVMAPEEAARLKEREALLMATANELSRSEEGRLETMSFSDLRSSALDDEQVRLPRLDDD